MWKNLLKAAKFARTAHAGQKRAHGEPYYKHPMAVARLLWDKGHHDPDLIAAAYLHDVVEDSGVSLMTLFELFGLRTARLVGSVTKHTGESREDYFKRVKAAGPLAVALKLADREHNNSQLELAPPECAQLREKAAAKSALMLKIFNS